MAVLQTGEAQDLRFRVQDTLIHTLKRVAWQVNPLITITTGVRGAIHEQPIKEPKINKIIQN